MVFLVQTKKSTSFTPLLGSLPSNLLQPYNAQRVIQARIGKQLRKQGKEKERDRIGLDWDKRNKTRMIENKVKGEGYTEHIGRVGIKDHIEDGKEQGKGKKN